MHNDTPAYYRITPTADVHAWAAQWLAKSPWATTSQGIQLMLVWHDLLRYVVRLPHKGQHAAAQVSDARKAQQCAADLLALLDAQVREAQAQPPATAMAYGSWSALATPPQSIAYDQLSEEQQEHIAQRHEPGSRWYYWMHNQEMQGARQHEVESYERNVAPELANGALRRVIMIPGED